MASLDYPFAVVAVDVGGTKIACATVRYDREGDAPVVADKRTVPTEAALGGQAVLEKVLSLVDGQLRAVEEAGERIAGIGVSTAGRVDARTGNIAYANEIMPGWSGRPLGDALRERFDARSAVLGDVQSHALGEARWGAARGARTAIVAAPGTGLGGGIICHGRIVLGAHGFAGEIGAGPNPFDPDDGNLESWAAGSGIESRYAAATGRRLSGAEISRLANEEGDEQARAVLARAGKALGIALAGWANMLDPEVCVVSGSVTKAGPIWRDSFVGTFRRRVPGVLSSMPIVDAELGPDAPLVGAAEHLVDSLAAGR